jgi:hypothetical protein
LPLCTYEARTPERVDRNPTAAERRMMNEKERRTTPKQKRKLTSDLDKERLGRMNVPHKPVSRVSIISWYREALGTFHNGYL